MDLTVSKVVAQTAAEVVQECISGKLEKDGIVVQYESCATDTTSQSTISAADGRSLMELDYDKKTGSIQYWIGGVQINNNNTEAEEAQVAETLGLPEIRVAVLIPDALADMGLDPNSPRLMALRGNVVGPAIDADDPNRVVLLSADDPVSACLGRTCSAEGGTNLCPWEPGFVCESGEFGYCDIHASRWLRVFIRHVCCVVTGGSDSC